MTRFFPFSRRSKTQFLFAQAENLRAQQRWEDSLSEYDRVLQLDRRHYQAWRGKAIVLREMKRQEAALQCLDRAVQIKPRYSAGWRTKGAVLRDLGRHGEGLKCYERGLEIDPSDEILWRNKISALTTLDRPIDVAETLRLFVLRFPKPDSIQELHDRAVELLQRYQQTPSKERLPELHQAIRSCETLLRTHSVKGDLKDRAAIEKNLRTARLEDALAAGTAAGALNSRHGFNNSATWAQRVNLESVARELVDHLSLQAHKLHEQRQFDAALIAAERVLTVAEVHLQPGAAELNAYKTNIESIRKSREVRGRGERGDAALLQPAGRELKRDQRMFVYGDVINTSAVVGPPEPKVKEPRPQTQRQSLLKRLFRRK